MADTFIKCRKCGKLFSYEKYYGICPKCGVYTSLKSTTDDLYEDNGFDDNKYNRNGDGPSIYEQNNLDMGHTHNGNNEKFIYEQNDFNLDHSHQNETKKLSKEEEFYRKYHEEHYGEVAKEDIDKFKKSTEDIDEFVHKHKKHIPLVIFLFFINPFIAIIYIFIILKNNKNM